MPFAMLLFFFKANFLAVNKLECDPDIIYVVEKLKIYHCPIIAWRSKIIVLTSWRTNFSAQYC